MTVSNSPTAPRGFPLRRLRILGWLLPLGLLVLPFLLPIPEPLDKSRIARALGAQLHVPLLTAITIAIHRRGPLAGRLLAAALTALALGAGIEIVQRYVGRHGRLMDLAMDAVGIGLAVCWVQWRAQRSRAALVVGLLLLLVIPIRLHDLPQAIRAQRLAARRFPLLGDFETVTERKLWGDGESGRRRYPDVADAHGHVLEILGEPPERYPGSQQAGFPRDWSDHRFLEWDARASQPPADGSLILGVRLDDFRSSKDRVWVGRQFKVGPDWSHFSIDLREVARRTQGRPLRLDDMYTLLFYIDHPAQPVSVQIDNVRLN